MKGFLKIGCVMWGLILFTALLAHGEPPGRITVLHIVTPHWERFTNKDGTGVYFEIVRKVYEPVGIRVTFEIVPWKRAKKMIYANKADALLGEYRAEGLLLPRYPLHVEETDVVFKKEQLREWHGPESLEGQTAIWIRGYDFHETLADIGVKLRKWHEVDRAVQAWKMIDEGKVSFYLDSIDDLRQYIRLRQIDTARYGIEKVFRDNVYVEFGRSERSGALIGIYDRRMPELLASGEIQQIYDKWNIQFPLFEPASE